MEYDGMSYGGKAQKLGTLFLGGLARTDAVLAITFFIITH